MVFANLDAWIERKLAMDGTPRLSLVITDREKTLHTGTYGFADIAAKTPVTPEHLFEIGSIGKSFTALVLLRMAERGQIDLHQPVSSYLPWFAVQSPYEPITVHHLMTHTAGIIEGSDMAADGRFEAWHLRKTGVLGPPGEHFSYSNVGYKALGYLIEDVTGRPYEAVVRDEVLLPLGMTESLASITNADRARIAVPYRWPYADRPRRPEHRLVPDTWIETSTADGSIASTPRDMAIFARMLLNRGAGLISDEHFAVMRGDLAPRDPEDPDATYGYGLMTWEQDGHRVVGHGGGMVGHYAFVVVDPEVGIGVCTMVNGPGKPSRFAHAALGFARALPEQISPELPALEPPTVIAHAADYAGTYAGPEETWILVANGSSLVLERDDTRVQLEQRGDDQFFADDPALDRDLVVFERHDGAVVALHHGTRWLGRADADHEEPGPTPAIWETYVGRYQCHNPWLPMIRVLARRGRLLLMTGPGHEKPLIERSDGAFQVGASPSAETIRFDAVADGLALRADLNGQMYYRTPGSSIRSRKT